MGRVRTDELARLARRQTPAWFDSLDGSVGTVLFNLGITYSVELDKSKGQLHKFSEADLVAAIPDNCLKLTPAERDEGKIFYNIRKRDRVNESLKKRVFVVQNGTVNKYQPNPSGGCGKWMGRIRGAEVVGLSQPPK